MWDTINMGIHVGYNKHKNTRRHNQQIPGRKHNASSLLMKGQGVSV